MRENILGKEKIYKLFIKFCIPAVIAMIINGTQSIIDGIFLGNFVGANAMASVNIVQPFMQLIIGSTMIVCMGAISIIGRKLGEGSLKDAENTFKTASLCVFFTSFSIAILGITLNITIAKALGANDVLLNGSTTYIKVISCFAPIMSFLFLFGFTSRLIEKPHLYLNGTILGVILNVVLDYLFIVVLDFGIAGAALATGIAYLGGFIVVAIPAFQRKNKLNIFVGSFSPKFILPMIYNGSSEAIVSLSAALTTYLFNITFIKIAGESGVAAFTTINYVANFSTLLMFGISDGIGAIVSYNFGNKNYNRVYTTIKLAIKTNLIFGIILFLGLFFGGSFLGSIFAGDNNVIINLVSAGSKLYSFSFILSGFNIVTSGYFTSIGKAKESVIVAACRGIVFILIGIIILPQFFNINGVWLTVAFAEIITALISILLLKKNYINIQTISDNVEVI